jgi:hypothetical protein
MFIKRLVHGKREMPENLFSRMMQIFKARALYSHILFLVSLFFYALLSLKTIFLEGMILGGNNPVYYVNSYLTAFYMLPKLNLLGWDPFNQFGWVFNQYCGPGTSIFVSSIYYFFLGQIDLLLAYKIAFFLAYFLLAPAVYMFVHVFTEDKVAAAVASFLSITTFTEEKALYDIGLKQMYYMGVLPERLGLVFAFFSIAFLAYSFKSKTLSKTLFLTGWSSLLFSMTVLTHMTMGISVGVMGILLWFFTSLKIFGGFIAEPAAQRLVSVLKTEVVVLIKFASIGLLSLGMAAFWIVPLFQTLGTYYSLPATQPVGPFIFGEIFISIPWYLLIFYLIGAFPVFIEKPSYSNLVSSSVILVLQFMNLISLYDGNIGLRLILAFATSLILLLSSNDLFVSFSLAVISLFGFLATGPETYLVSFGPVRLNMLSLIPFARSLECSRFSAPARILVLCLMALGLVKLLRRLYSLSKKAKVSTVSLIATGLLAFLVINSSLSAQVQNTDLAYPWSREKMFKLTSDYPSFKKVDELISWVKNNVPNNTYILFQDTSDLNGEDFGISHYIYIASLVLKRPLIGGCFATSYITSPYANSEERYLLSFKIEKLLENETLLRRLMDELGIGYIAIHDAALIRALNASNSFMLEYYNGIYTVFRKTGFSKTISIEGNGVVESVDFAVNRIEVTVDGVSGNSSYLFVRQVNYPGFTAEVDGETVQIDTYYPKLPNVIMDWRWIRSVYNWRVPFMRIKLQPGSRKIVLSYNLHTTGDDASQASWIIFLCLLASATILLIENMIRKRLVSRVKNMSCV